MEFLTGFLAARMPPDPDRAGGGLSRAARRIARVWGRRCWAVALCLSLSIALPPSGAGASEFDEYAVKAAYLYNFAKFVEWPASAFESADAPLSICIAGNNPFGGALDSLSGKMVESRPVAVRHVPAATGLEKCHIVYIGRSEQGRFKAVLAKLARLPVLTVGDIADFAQEGGMIGLVEAEQRIRFNINVAMTRQANLKLSSQLLKLATIVE